MLTFGIIGAIPYPHIDPVIVDFGFIAIRWYSLAYLGGILFAWWYIRRLTTQPGAPMSKDHIDDLITWAVFGIILGGRLGYVLFYDFAKYIDDPVAIVRFWDGGITGMSFHGGFLGVVIAVILFARKHKLDLMRVADVVAIVSPIGLLVGRIANFINGELWGRETDIAWGMVFPTDPEQLIRHPSQLYEAFGEGLLLFLILQFLYHKTRIAKDMPGVITGVFIAVYGITRLLIEFVREPDAHIGLIAGVSRGQMLSVPMILVALWFVNYGIQRKKQQA